MEGLVKDFRNCPSCPDSAAGERLPGTTENQGELMNTLTAPSCKNCWLLFSPDMSYAQPALECLDLLSFNLTLQFLMMIVKLVSRM